MEQSTKGILVFVAGIAMLMGLVAVEIAQLEAWESWTTPGFIAKLLAHIAAVLTAFVGGKLMPTDRN